MKHLYDLHLHSNLSDGDYDIEKVFKLAKKNGLSLISVTDHNVWLDFEKKNEIAKKNNIENIPGIEISTKFQDVEVHILGYANRFDTGVLRAGLIKTIRGYNLRASLIVEKLKEAGVFNLDFKLIKKMKRKDLPITKYDIVKFANKVCKMPIKVIQRLFNKKDDQYYVPYGDWAMKPEAAVKLIHNAGGIAVLAHPGETLDKLAGTCGFKKGWNEFDKLVRLLMKNKIDGIEIYSPKNDKQMREYCLKVIKNNNLLITGGSDWHGEKHHPELSMGCALPEKNLTSFLKAL